MRLLSLLVVFMLGCGPLYRVQKVGDPAGDESKVNKVDDAAGAESGDRWETLGLYMLPRTDLRVDAEVAMSHTTYGQHYCFGKNFGLGEGRVGTSECATTCLPRQVLVPLVRKLEITPVTVPDTSAEYEYQIRDSRRAAKRTSEFVANNQALLSGTQLPQEATTGSIAFGAFKGERHTVEAKFEDPKAPGADATCENIERSASRAANDYRLKDTCLKKLGETEGAMGEPWSVWSRWRDCRAAAGRFKAALQGKTGGEAVDLLGPEVRAIESTFEVRRASETFSFQTWVRVGAQTEDAPGDVVLDVGKPVGVCRGPNMSVQVCNEEQGAQLIKMRLDPVVTGLDPVVTGSDDPPTDGLDAGNGLLYRLPRTMLLKVVLRPGADTEESTLDELALRSTQVEPVTFPQLGPFVRAPNKLRAAPATIRFDVSEETGMLTKASVSLDPVMRKQAAPRTLRTVQTVTYENAQEQGAAAAAAKLEEDNRLLRAQQENDCLRGLGRDCDDSEGSK